MVARKTYSRVAATAEARRKHAASPHQPDILDAVLRDAHWDDSLQKWGDL
jgi:hypothetical protein